MKRRAERGSGLILAMLLLAAAATLGSVMLERSRSVRAETRTDLLRLRGLHAAGAGIEQARHELAHDPDHRGCSLRIGGLEVEVRVARAGEGWSVVSTARPGSVRLEATLAPAPGLPRLTRWSERTGAG